MSTGIRPARWFAVTILLVFLLPANGAVAETVEEDVAACQLLMKRKKWSAAADAWLALFETHTRSPEILRLLPEIEESIQLCLFRKATSLPDGRTLYGSAVRDFDAKSRKVSLEFRSVEKHPLWSTDGASFHVLTLRLENDLTLEFDGWFGYYGKSRALNAMGITVYLCWNPERGSGYRLQPGFRFEKSGYGSKEDMIYSRPALIERIDPGGDRELYKRQHGTAILVLGHTIRVQRAGGTMKVYSDRKLRASASDSDFKGGFLALRSAKIQNVQIKGRLEEAFHRQKLAAWLEVKFRAWRKGSWTREDHIPAWARSPSGSAPVRSGDPLPSDAPAVTRKDLEEVLGLWRERKEAELLARIVKLGPMPERTGLFLEGLSALALSAPLRAEVALSELVTREPAFGGGWLFLGIARFRLRRIEEARTDLARAAELGCDGVEHAIAGASVALYEGELAQADGILADARSRGLSSRLLNSFATWLHRAKTGPRWTQRYEYEGRSHVVQSDHSKEICRDVGKLLEASLLAYLNRYPRVTRPGGKVRVYVFASRQGFLAYAGELGRNLESAAGAYSVMTRELLLWMPQSNRSKLMETVRHEGFHAFLHEFIEQVPPWLDEGYAQYFERGRMSGRRLALGEADLDLVRRIRGRWRPTPESLNALLAFDHTTFMADAPANYARAWALVHFLESTKDRKLRTLKDRFFEELRSGRTPEEAKKSVFDPVLDHLASKFDAHWSELLKKTIER